MPFRISGTRFSPNVTPVRGKLGGGSFTNSPFNVYDSADTGFVDGSPENGILWHSNGRLLANQGSDIEWWPGTPLMYRDDNPAPSSGSEMRIGLLEKYGSGTFNANAASGNVFLRLDTGLWYDIQPFDFLMLALADGQSGGFRVQVEYRQNGGSDAEASHQLEYAWARV